MQYCNLLVKRILAVSAFSPQWGCCGSLNKQGYLNSRGARSRRSPHAVSSLVQPGVVASFLRRLPQPWLASSPGWPVFCFPCLSFTSQRSRQQPARPHPLSRLAILLLPVLLLSPLLPRSSLSPSAFLAPRTSLSQLLYPPSIIRLVHFLLPLHPPLHPPPPRHQ